MGWVRGWAQGLAVSYAELGQYEKASDQLVALTKVGSRDTMMGQPQGGVGW